MPALDNNTNMVNNFIYTLTLMHPHCGLRNKFRMTFCWIASKDYGIHNVNQPAIKNATEANTPPKSA